MQHQKPFLLLVFLFVLVLADRGCAQILNIEKFRLNDEVERRFYSNISFNFRLYNRTAAEDDPIKLLSMNSNLDLAYFSANHSYMSLNHADYLSINEDPFTSFGYTHFRVNFMRKNRLSFELFSQLQYDLLRGLDRRFLGGGGIRLRLIDKEKISIYYNLGFMQEHERWDNPQEEGRQATTNIPKCTSHMTFRYGPRQNVDMNFVFYYQVGRDNIEKLYRNRWNIISNINFNINRYLSFRVSFSSSYDNRPIVPITKFIYSISNGIQFNFDTARKSKKS